MTRKDFEAVLKASNVVQQSDCTLFMDYCECAIKHLKQMFSGEQEVDEDACFDFFLDMFRSSDMTFEHFRVNVEANRLCLLSRAIRRSAKDIFLTTLSASYSSDSIVYNSIVSACDNDLATILRKDGGVLENDTAQINLDRKVEIAYRHYLNLFDSCFRMPQLFLSQLAQSQELRKDIVVLQKDDYENKYLSVYYDIRNGLYSVVERWYKKMLLETTHENWVANCENLAHSLADHLVNFITIRDYMNEQLAFEKDVREFDKNKSLEIKKVTMQLEHLKEVQYTSKHFLELLHSNLNISFSKRYLKGLDFNKQARLKDLHANFFSYLFFTILELLEKDKVLLEKLSPEYSFDIKTNSGELKLTIRLSLFIFDICQTIGFEWVKSNGDKIDNTIDSDKNIYDYIKGRIFKRRGKERHIVDVFPYDDVKGLLVEEAKKLFQPTYYDKIYS